ncbi:hypothetical protein KDK_54200 [Dictyobacter kobayashii]|uniref:Uncharacterized protein n=1 Tax=Dictyobacter kobayashii TaxID=2014872 RepID=A0A402AR91_9CHLR|nr:hypothetical protein KDK_54200 [Dictyobacter kobayashii]
MTAGGETLPSPLATVTTSSGNQKVNLSNIMLGNSQPGQPGVSNPVIGRALYRSLVGSSTLYLLTTLSDTVSSSFSDTLPDSGLLNQPQAPQVNSSGIMRWPPVERAFSEFSNLFDSAVALAVGGNLGSQGTAGRGSSVVGSQQPTFTLQLPAGELPQDNSLLMRIFYATKHQLDSSGSTIPEVHRDLIVLGASAYAMEAYQVPTNDNFDVQDGALHDRLDDTRIPTAWAATAGQRMAQFMARLQEIKQQRDYASAARLHWGDIPRYWGRL